MNTLKTENTFTPITSKEPEVDWSLGWRTEMVVTENGQAKQVRIPLTPEEARHPQEGYIMPERTEHDFISDDLCDMLRPHYEDHNTVAVFRNLIFKWDVPGVESYAPDVAVVPNVRNPTLNRRQFVVTEEGTRPVLAIEVVSRSSRHDDRVSKPKEYAKVGIREYVYIDSHRTRKGQVVWDVVGHRLQNGEYIPIIPDEDGAIFLESVQMRIGMEEDHVWLEDAITGEDLMTNLQARRALRKAILVAEREERERQIAEAWAEEEAAARLAAEARAEEEAIARLAAEARSAQLESEIKILMQKLQKT